MLSDCLVGGLLLGRLDEVGILGGHISVLGAKALEIGKMRSRKKPRRTGHLVTAQQVGEISLVEGVLWY